MASHSSSTILANSFALLIRQEVIPVTLTSTINEELASPAALVIEIPRKPTSTGSYHFRQVANSVPVCDNLFAWACFVTIGFCFKVVRVSLATTVDKTFAFSSAAVVIISWKTSSAWARNLGKQTGTLSLTILLCLKIVLISKAAAINEHFALTAGRVKIVSWKVSITGSSGLGKVTDAQELGSARGSQRTWAEM